MKKVLLAVVLCLVLLSASVAIADDSFPVEVRRATISEYRVLYRVTDLDNGNVCYVYDGFQQGGISCLPGSIAPELEGNWP